MNVTTEPHDFVEITIACTLKEELLGTWEDVPTAAKEMFLDGSIGHLPCEGEGETGPACAHCPYCVLPE